MKILTILGARPQFIKAAMVSRAIQARDDIEEIIIHTGQHFDANMSDVFFAQLDIPKPHHNLGIASLSHGAMTGRMLEHIEALVKREQPGWVLLYGDTNSTLAGALAAAKLQIPVAHVEAGLRSHNPAMPEEINRVLTDRISTLLLCPTETSVNNLKHEGFPFTASGENKGQQIQRIENIGDVMYDAALYYRELAMKHVNLEAFNLQEKAYALCTLHRQENTEDSIRLGRIFGALRAIAKDLPVILPLHPRTKLKLEQQKGSGLLKGLITLDPLPYLEMQRLEMSAKVILTDSGGMQKEAYFHQVPCVTLRDETEWTESVEFAWNKLVGADRTAIIRAAQNAESPATKQAALYGDGHAAEKIVRLLV